MSRQAYHSSWKDNLLWLGVCLLGVAGTVATTMVLGSHPVTKDWPWGVGLGLGCLPFITGLGLAVYLDRRLKRWRHQGIADLLAPMGYDVTLQPGEKDKEVLFRYIGAFTGSLDLRAGPVGVKWAAFRNPPGGGQELVGEYQFITGSGKSTVEHTRMSAVIPDKWLDHGGVPKGWHNAVVIRRQGRWTRRGSREKENRHPSFAGLEERWAIFGDTATAGRLLTPDFQEILAASPKGEMWCLGGDLLCCGYHAPLNGENFLRFLERVWQASGGTSPHSL